MQFLLTVLAILVCFATVLQHGEAKPLSKAEKQRELSVLDDLITYLSRRDDDDLPLFPPQEQSSNTDDLQPTENADLPKTENADLPKTENADLPKTEDADRPKTGNADLPKTEIADLPKSDIADLPKNEKSGENEQGDEISDNPPAGGKDSETTGTVGFEGEQNSVNEIESGSNNEDNKNPYDLEENLRHEFDGVRENVENLLDIIKEGLRNGKLNEAGDIVDFLIEFLENLEDYDQIVQTNVQKTDKALDEIESEMQNAAEHLQPNNDKTPEIASEIEELEESQTNVGFDEEETESEAATGGVEEQSPDDDVEDENQINQIADPNKEGKPVIGAALKPSGDDEENTGSGPAERPASGAGEQKSPPMRNGEGEVNQPGGTGAGDDEGEASTAFKRKNVLQNNELLRLIRKLKELKA